MKRAYYQLLEATIQHLETLKARGVGFVAVSPQRLAGFSSRPRPGNRTGPSESSQATKLAQAKPNEPLLSRSEPPARCDQFQEIAFPSEANASASSKPQLGAEA